MRKEIIIIILIFLIVIFGNIVTQNYVRKCVEQIDQELLLLRDELSKEDVDKEKSQDKINEIHKTWDDMYKKLAFYIQHDELEKVEIQLSSIRGNIDVDNFDQSVPELDKCIYILNHIKEKESLKIQNIF